MALRDLICQGAGQHFVDEEEKSSAVIAGERASLGIASSSNLGRASIDEAMAPEFVPPGADVTDAEQRRYR